MTTLQEYSVPAEAEKIFKSGILQNPLINKYIPEDAANHASLVSFTGSAKPTLPINWRFAESISALKAFEAILVNCLAHRKYDVVRGRVSINTDHAQLFVMSPMLWTLDPQGAKLNVLSSANSESKKTFERMFPDWDIHASSSSNYRQNATNIYKCKDGSFFHIHGSLNPAHTLRALGLPENDSIEGQDESKKPIIEAVSQLTKEEVFQKTITEARQAGTYCLTTDQYRQSEHGKANEHVGLFEIHHKPTSGQGSCWWPEGSVQSSAARPLTGLKIVDLTRVIAAPAICRGLAELGASVMRVVAPHQPDFSRLHVDLNHGKWNSLIDLREETGKQQLRELILDADVVVQGYRPGVFDKYGFSQEDILELCKNRERGIIYVRENCFGWNGPWKGITGWQQISDAVCGVSMEFGRAMGNDEPVTPILPNSDFCTGVAGICAILAALMERAEKGGSYTIDVALNYYSRWLIDHVGTYPPEVWKDVFERNGSIVLRHHQAMHESIPIFMQQVMRKSGSVLLQPDFFREYPIEHLDTSVRAVAPVIEFPDGPVQLGFNVGTRSNGVDKPHWPKDLSVEVVT